MGSLASYLQREFVRHCPPGWTCHTERRLLTPDVDQLLGYSSRVDVLLERVDRSRRLWIEFEVSRADPVANHAKFAVAHLFHPQLHIDTFVSMISPHVERGRSNLAANTILLLRYIGMRAFQTVLLPHLSAEGIKNLNKVKSDNIDASVIDIQSEINRVLTISEPVIVNQKHKIHFAGNFLEVMLNIHRWNNDISTEIGKSMWNKRRITYFAFDPKSKLFAPAKFCAYIVLPSIPVTGIAPSLNQMISEMTIHVYTDLDETEPLFDGHRAQAHLTKSLAMPRYLPDEVPDVTSSFERWLEIHKDSIVVHSSGPVFILPPT